MTLADECKLLTRYLLDREPSSEILARYAAAHQALNLGADEPELHFWHRHPRSLPLLDAAAGILRSRSVVRKKVYLMAALLETTPEHAAFFLQKPNSMWPAIGGLFWLGVRSLVKVLVGIPVFLLARRRA